MATIVFENGTRVRFEGSPTPADVEEVAVKLGISKSEAPASAPAPEVDTYGASFPARPDDTPLEAGAKALGNLPSSVLNLGKNVVDAVTHPVRTAEGIGGVVSGALDKTVGRAIGLTPDPENEARFNAFTEALKQRYGSLENLQRTATNDPFGFGSELFGIVRGGASLAGQTAKVDAAVSTLAKPVMKPVQAAAETVKKTGSDATAFAASQATGLDRETLSTAMRAPKELSAAQQSGLNRATLGQDLKNVIDKRIEYVSDLGSGYKSVREQAARVALPEGWFDDILKKHKLTVADGKIVATRDSTVLNSADVGALQNFYDVYGRDPIHTPNSYLNTREALTQLAKYDAAKTGNLQSIARDARTELNRSRNQIEGLKELDAQYAPEVEDLNLIKKEWIDPKTGELKDSALSRIANATNQTNAQRLARLEKVRPGITKQIQLLRAIEDIEKAAGVKVGTYTRTLTQGAGVAGAMTGNIPMVVAAILAQPEIALPLIKGLGLTRAKLQPLLAALRKAAGDINNFRLPAPAPAEPVSQ